MPSNDRRGECERFAIFGKDGRQHENGKNKESRKSGRASEIFSAFLFSLFHPSYGKIP
jgi:hypothetical protein